MSLSDKIIGVLCLAGFIYLCIASYYWHKASVKLREKMIEKDNGR